MKGLYIHIPFCKHICSYCDFPKMVTFSFERMASYIDRVIEELKEKEEDIKDIRTIYIGGGTPNALPIHLLKKLFEALKKYQDSITEYSIEINPELLTLEYAKLFKEYNITRVSIGGESFNDDILKKLGRHHKKDDILNSISILRNVGIFNINVDLIFAHPFDNFNLIDENLKYIKELNLNHVSYYSMILEENTIFSYQLENHKIKLLDEDTEGEMYDYIIDKLKSIGYHHYEISNFAKNGFESVHNLIYWSMDEYVGIGLGAASLINNKRITNSLNFKEYILNKNQNIINYSLKDLENDFMMLGFRKIDGINDSDFYLKYHAHIKDIFDLNKLLDEGLIIENNLNYKLTKKGIDLANLVFMEFLGD